MIKRGTKRGSKRQLAPLLVIVGGLALLVIGWWWGNRPSPADIEQQAGGGEVSFSSADVVRVSLAEAKAGYDDDSVLMVDVRCEAAYLNGHIPGAVLMPTSEVNSRYRELPKDKLLYLYCT